MCQSHPRYCTLAAAHPASIWPTEVIDALPPLQIEAGVVNADVGWFFDNQSQFVFRDGRNPQAGYPRSHTLVLEAAQAADNFALILSLETKVVFRVLTMTSWILYNIKHHTLVLEATDRLCPYVSYYRPSAVREFLHPYTAPVMSIVLNTITKHSRKSVSVIEYASIVIR